MELAELVKTLGLEVRSARGSLGNKVNGGYVSDLLSDVIGNSRKGDLWITLQIHLNVVAVAVLKEIAGIVLVGGREPEADTIERAEAENIPILTTSLPAFELAGKLYALGVRAASDERASTK